jgi:hypothetical protein
MDQRESDPTGAFSGGGAAGLEDATQLERRTPKGEGTTGVDETEREVVTSGTAATSEVADPEAQADAESQGDGTPLPG